MIRKERPKYSGIFEYLDENYEFNRPPGEFVAFYRKDMLENHYKQLTGPVAKENTKFPNKKAAADSIRHFAWAAGADLVGFTKVKDCFVYDGIELEEEFAISLGFEMDFDKIATAPAMPSGEEVIRAYWRLGEIVIAVAEFIRGLGYNATAHHPRSFVDAGITILHPVAAFEAGLGEFGRLGLLITEEFGPRVRFGTVTTSLELPQNKKKTFGVEKYCESCQICREVCEGSAIPDKKGMVSGHLKYTIDPYKCLPYYAEFGGCNLCVAKCPFNKRPKALKKFIEQLNNLR